MSIKYFTLTEGVLELHSDKLVIFDDAKRNRFSNILVSVSGFLYALASIIRGYKDKEDWWFYFGIVLSLFWIFFFIIRKDEFHRIDDEIYLNDILEVSFKGGRNNTTIGTILTREKRIRKIIMENNENLANQFKNNLKELNIKVLND